jgi:large subunit ribosomal protein L17
MKHLKTGRKFGREKNQRGALMRSLALSLINYNKIQTTEAKARELRPFIERIITKAKTDNVHSRRLLRSRLGVDNKKLFEEIAPSYKDRNGGYTRITKLGNRDIDGSPVAQIELV